MSVDMCRLQSVPVSLDCSISKQMAPRLCLCGVCLRVCARMLVISISHKEGQGYVKPPRVIVGHMHQ